MDAFFAIRPGRSPIFVNDVFCMGRAIARACGGLARVLAFPRLRDCDHP